MRFGLLCHIGRDHQCDLLLLVMAEKEQSADVQYWTNCISVYEREFKKWEGRSDKIIKRYRDENRIKSDSLSKFNI